jgi:hypothetical protein
MLFVEYLIACFIIYSNEGKIDPILLVVILLLLGILALLGVGKVDIDVTPSIPGHLGMVLQVHQEPFLQLATERLPDMMRVPRFEARNPS